MLLLNNMRIIDFSWGKMQQKSFEDIKNELWANPLKQPYSLQKEATVTTDASEKTIGGVLSQEGHKVIYVSRKLTHVEQNYPIIEQEALAIVFAVARFKQFLLGRRFTLQTDHKPLKYLIAPDEEIPKTASARTTRWAIALLGFDYELKYTPGEHTPCRCFEQNGFWRRRIGQRSSVLRNQQHLLRPRVIWWPKQKSKLNLERTDSSRT